MEYLSLDSTPVVRLSDGSALMWSDPKGDWGPTNSAALDVDTGVREYTKGGFKVLLELLDIPWSSVPTDAGKATPPASTNAANSGVGRYVIQLAAAQGAKSINIVRRPELVDELKAMGAEAVIVEGPGMAKAVREITGGEPLKLGLDAIGGDATLALGDCLTSDGVVVNYGLLSGEPCKLSSAATIFHDVSLRGFWLARWFRTAPIGERMSVMTEIGGRLATGELSAAIDSTYDLDHIGDALARAMEGGRDGKVLITPNGPVE